MHLKQISLANFRSAANVSIDLHPRMNLVIGVNGAGKSTVLQAIAYGLIGLVRRIQNTDDRKKIIPVADIANTSDSTCVALTAEFLSDSYKWQVCRNRPGATVSDNTDLVGAGNLSHALKKVFRSTGTMPIIVYYPVGRVVEKIPALVQRVAPTQESIDVYDNALEGRPNFHNFFRWFRDQDDYINQKSLSRAHWTKKNSQRFRWQISQLFERVERLLPSSKRDNALFREDRIRSLDFIIHEPRFLFREMSSMIHSLEITNASSSEFEKVLFELDYMLHRMDMLASESNDSVSDSKDGLLEILAQVLDLMCFIRIKEPKDNTISDVFWSMFMLSFELGLWWLSHEGHGHLVAELASIEWPTRPEEMPQFRNRIVHTISAIIASDIRRRSAAQINYGRDIQNVTRAIENFVPEYSNLRINRSERGTAQMLVDKNGKEFDIAQLSDGEKNVIALVGDIARRLTIGSPDSADPLLEKGVVLIDELDLHLHPKWQRIFAQNMLTVFPNCQFIVSSHSPQVISHVKPESVITLRHENGEMIKGFVKDSYGKNSDRILEDLMDETSRPKEIAEDINEVFRLIQTDQIDAAKSLIQFLRANIGEDGDLVKASVLMKRREIIGK